MIRKIIKRMFCDHEWEIICSSSYYTGKENFYCECKKCGKTNVITFEKPVKIYKKVNGGFKPIAEIGETNNKKFPTLTKFEYEYLERVYKYSGYKYVTRGSNGSLQLWCEKPIKGKEDWRSNGTYTMLWSIIYKDFLFVKWSDKEPWSIKELLENCEVE